MRLHMFFRPFYTCIVLCALFSCSSSEETDKSGNLTLVCRSGWRMWRSSCYFWVSSEMQQSDAKQFCSLYQSALLQIEDEVESVTVAGLAPVTPLWVDRQITGTFDCGHGRCVSETRKCNGINDCGNNLDEMNCASPEDPKWPPPSPCSYRFESDTGSVNYNLQSHRYTDCVWTIVSSPGTQIVLRFQSYDLEGNLDTLEVRSGGQTMSDSQVLDTLTGSASKETIHSLNNMVILRLLTDWSTRGSSFHMQWSVVNNIRRWTVGDDWKQLFTPFYLESTHLLPFYLEWLVTSAQGTTLTLKMKDIDVKGEWEILVYNGDTYDDVLVNATKVEDLASPAVYFSTSSLVRVVMRGQHITRESKGICILAKAGCDLEIDEYPGVLSSSGFSQNVYPSSLMCGWLFTVPYGYGNKITIRFLSFLLQTKGSFVEVLNGSSASAPPLFIGSTYTGDYRLSPINMEGVGPLFVRFVSDHFQETGGFQMMFSIDCRSIPNSQGLVKSSDSTSVGTVVNISCASGFAFRQQEFFKKEVTLTCQWTGLWDVVRMPSCHAVYCGSPTPLLSGYVESYSGSVKYRGTATYRCYAGYRLVGDPLVTCLGNGQWSTPPNCEPTSDQVTCGEAPDISNAKKVYLSSFGNIVEYRCVPGYQIIGSPRRLCQKDGAWSLSSPRCAKLRCPLPEIRNGVFGSTGAVEFGSNITVICNNDYVLSSYKRQTGNLVCEADKTFGGEIGCEDLDECTGSICGEDRLCVNTIGSYNCQCRPGFKPGLGSECTNVDECEEGSHRCEQICMDTIGSHMCSCNQGYTLRQEGGNFACDKLDQSDNEENAPGCSALTPMGSATQRSLVQNIYPATSLLPGQSVTVVCERPDGSKENRTLFCAYDATTKGFSLQGDSPLCHVVDCGPMEVHKGQVAPTLTSTEYGASYVYTCKAGATLTGQSSSGDNVVRCLANGAWGYGSLACSVGKCEDPGTPAGTIQEWDSYEIGGNVTYSCARVGYSLSHTYNLTCVLMFGGLQWNNPTPTCSDVRPPTFTSCGDGEITLKVNRMDVPDISMIAKDTSGPVKSITVSPVTFNVADPILSNTTVSYTATDHAGNVAICKVIILLKDLTPGSLECLDLLTYNLTSASTTMYNVEERMRYSGGQLVNPPRIEVSPRTVDTELNYRVTLQTEDGVNSTCTIKVKVIAGSCFHDTRKQADNAVTTRVDNSSYTTIVICDVGYSFPDGSVSRFYTCAGTNQWNQGDPAQPCRAVAYKMSYYIELQTSSAVFLNSDSYCRVNVSSVYSFLSSPESVLNNLCERGRQTDSDTFYRFRLLSAQFEEPIHRYRHKMSLSLRVENYDGVLTKLESCNGLIASRKTDLFTVNTDECRFTVELLTNASAATGDTCGTGYNDTGANDMCSLCPPGTYWLSDGTCEECLDGQFQNEAGQETCKHCSAHSRSVLPRTSAKNCIGHCQDGFVSRSGEPPCELCGVDTYWSSPTVCAPCPDGGSTLRVDGAPNITFCKNPCPAGHYSTSGYAPCTSCPLHFYQSSTGQTSCRECAYNEVTNSLGSTSSADCQPIETSQNSCSKCFSAGKENCEYHRHRGICYCKPGYTGSRCETLYDHCASMPCYNNGVCTPLINDYSCTCHAGSAGVNCKQDVMDDCANNSCSGDSVCRDLMGQYQCVCADSQTKDHRCYAKDSDPCTPNPCLQGGTCLSKVQGRIQCLCQPGTTGTMCQSIIDNCVLNPSGCLHGGTCVNAINSYRCECPPDLTGDHCQMETRTCASGYCSNGVCNSQGLCTCLHPYQLDERGECTVYDHCASSPCGVGSENCITHGEGYECVCRDGYEGARCQFKEDYCKTDDCLQGSCQSLNTNYTCLCEEGWQGRWCHESKDDCAMQCTGPTAISCQDRHLDFACICEPGYTGKNCTDDINECASFPCQHGGTCSQGLADYTCTCMEGWEGKDCENIKNTCTPGSCLNDGICYNVFNGHYCSCHKGTYGERCEVAHDMCNIVQPCLSAPCETINGTALCSCRQFYSGSSCELVKDCSTTPCKNGATCILRSPVGYTCHCALGFTGTHCENSICPEVCPGGATCVHEGFHTYCLCPPSSIRSGSECKAFSSDFDLYLLGGGGTFPTHSPPFKVSPSTTLSLWITYYNSGRSLILSKLDSTLALMELYHDRVILRNVPLNFGSYNLKQVRGQWSHVTVTWSDNRIFTVFINGIQINQITLSTDIHIYDNLYSASFDTDFTGYISQLTVWKRVLSITDIRLAAQGANFNKHDDLELGWTRYVLNGLSRTYRPSRAGLGVSSCDTDREQAPNCPDTQEEEEYKCPEVEISFTTKERVTNISDVLSFPSPGQQITYYTTLTGSYISWGRHDVVFVLLDKQERYTICRVKLYIRDTDSCDTSGLPAHTSCGSDSLSDLCGPNRHPSIPTPNTLQCGKLGSFNLTHPSSAYSRPPCGEVTDLLLTTTLTLRYEMTLQCTDLSRNTLVRRLGDQLNSILPRSWPQLYGSGSSLDMSSTCDSMNVIVDIIFDNVPEMITKADTDIAASTEAVLYILATKTTELDVPTIAQLDKETVMVRTKHYCNGTAMSRKCVSCGAGSYLDKSVGHCQRCAIGTFTDASSQPLCRPCLQGKITATTGSKKITDCILDCPAGFMAEESGSSCVPCPRGFFQNKTGEVFCFPCPADKTTADISATSLNDCSEPVTLFFTTTKPEVMTSKLALTTRATSGTTSQSREDKTPPSTTISTTILSSDAQTKEHILDVPTISGIAAAGGGLLVIGLLADCCYRHRRHRRTPGLKDANRSDGDEQTDTTDHIYEEVHDSQRETDPNLAYITAIYSSNTSVPEDTANYYSVLNDSTRGDNSYSKIKRDRKSRKHDRSRKNTGEIQVTMERQAVSQVFNLMDNPRSRTSMDSQKGLTAHNRRRTVSDNHLERRNKRRKLAVGPSLRIDNGQTFMGYGTGRF